MAVTAERLRKRVGWDVALRGILEAMHGDERAESAQATRTGVARVFVAWRTDPEHRARCPLQVEEPADGAAGELRPADGADGAVPVTAERLRERVGWDVALRGFLEANAWR